MDEVFAYSLTADHCFGKLLHSFKALLSPCSVSVGIVMIFRCYSAHLCLCQSPSPRVFRVFLLLFPFFFLLSNPFLSSRFNGRSKPSAGEAQPSSFSSIYQTRVWFIRPALNTSTISLPNRCRLLVSLSHRLCVPLSAHD